MKSKKLEEALVDEDACPKCLGELDTGFECNDCGFDGIDFVDSAKICFVEDV